LLIRARAPLFRSVELSFQPTNALNLSRLGKPGGKSPGLWGEEYATIRPPSPLRPWELNNAFLEGIALLQTYPIGAAGGIDRVLQIRCGEGLPTKAPWTIHHRRRHQFHLYNRLLHCPLKVLQSQSPPVHLLTLRLLFGVMRKNSKTLTQLQRSRKSAQIGVQK